MLRGGAFICVPIYMRAQRFWYVKVWMQKSSKAATDLVAAFELYISRF